MSTFPNSVPAVYAGLEPAEVWRHFAAFNSIPRPSGHETGVTHYIQRVAEAHQAMWKTDSRGNCVVRVPPRNAGTQAPIVVLQAHTDMVCQKRPDVVHDFETDPIVPRRLGDQIFASGTTLGADNGIGACLALAILTTPGLTHGPLELLFTVEEETGLYGAANLDPELIRGRMMVNLDSEDPKEITIGCAGGAGTSLYLPLAFEPIPEGYVVRRVCVGGLQGGHSGVQIHEALANSLKVLCSVVSSGSLAVSGARLIAVDGGTAHNAIPRDSYAIVALPASELDKFEAAVRADEIVPKWRQHEPGISVKLEPANSERMMTLQSTQNCLQLLRELPHGVYKYSETFHGKVETSSNLAEAHTVGDTLDLHVSNRSFLAAELKEAQARVAAVAEDVGARIVARDGYPGWEPRAESPLLQATIDAARQVCDEVPTVEVVHAGLECGILSEKLPGLDAVSFGPLIRGAHTPEEWVSISSTEATWQLLLALLDILSRPGRESAAD